MENKRGILNILLLSLDDKFAKRVSLILADYLDMFVADCKELIEYDLIDSKSVLETCGLEYFKKRESKVIARCSQYENTVLTADINLYKDYYKFFNNSLIVYLNVDKEKVTKTVNKISFENYDDFLKENVDFIVDTDENLDEERAVEVVKRMGEFL